MKKVSLIVPVRIGSTRLPGKTFLKIGDVSIINIFVNRVKQLKNIDKFIIASTTNTDDDIVEEFCEKNDIDLFRGSEKDVFERFKLCCEKFGIRYVCRLTSDNPLFDYVYLDNLIKKFVECDVDCVKYIGGIDGVIEGEVFDMIKLKKYEKIFSDTDKEHVTQFIYKNPDVFEVKYFVFNEFIDHSLWHPIYFFSHIRLTLDTSDDFSLISILVNEFKTNIFEITFVDILHFLESNEHLINMNDCMYKDENKKNFLSIYTNIK
jgi:spore coat polysaccharide biosynthesis protein SpsF